MEEVRVQTSDSATKMLGDALNDQIVAMQAAFIEWQHGKGAEAAMVWIANTLSGPGLIPDKYEPYGTEAQAWWDANNSHPMPACACGRPSNRMQGKATGCCEEHFQTALIIQAGQKESV